MSRRLALLAAVAAAVAVSPASAFAADATVGHKVLSIPSREGAEPRPVDVHLWYPADPADVVGKPTTFYTSKYYGIALPSPFKALSWRFDAENAVENPAVDPAGGPFPVIVFSHGSVNDPINSAHLLERIAAKGFIVAAPTHVTDTQEDVRIEFINGRLGASTPADLQRCQLPGLTRPCARPGAGIAGVAPRMVERAKDLSNVLDALPGWFPGRADMTRVGVFGHSRGTITGMTAAAGSKTSKGGVPAWGIDPDPRVKAVMGMASGGQLAVTVEPDLEKINIPTLLVAGGLDQNSPMLVNEGLYNQIGCPVASTVCTAADAKAYKRFVVLPNAHHRTFIGTFCDQFQAVGAIARNPVDGKVDPNAIWEAGALNMPNSYQFLTQTISGRVMDYCSLDTFRSPVDISSLVKSVTPPGFCIDSPLVDPGPGPCPEHGTVPTTGLDEDTVKVQMAELAVEFFTNHRVRDSDEDGMPDAVDSDRDGDGVLDTGDNCRDDPNADQANADALEGGDSLGDACDETPYGEIKPTIDAPGSIEIVATAPSGTTVSYNVSAFDALDGIVAVTCTPVSGSLFAIGDTTVTCTATDRGANTATASFVVTVKGGDSQLADLRSAVDGIGPGYSLINKIGTVQATLANNDVPGGCSILSAFVNEVGAQSGKKIPVGTAASLIADARRIRAVLGC